MDTSPITSWQHVTAYFTFANQHGMVDAILILSIIITLAVIASIMRHESRSEAALLESKPELQTAALATEAEG